MDKIIDRKELLNKLINYDESINSLIDKLTNYEWDIDEELVILNRKQIAHSIRLFLDEKISETELVEWANAVEMRDGIGYEKGYEKLIADSLFQLGTPEINHPHKREYLVQLVANLLLRGNDEERQK